MEAALAATVMALTITGMIGVIESGSQMLDLSRKQTIAAQILQDEINQLRLQSWSTLTSGPTAIPSTLSPVGAPFTVSSVFAYAGGNFTCQYMANQITDLGGTSIPVLQVTFVVSWTGISGRSYSRTSTTLVSKNGLSVAYQKS
jgi:hypothetical protein